MTGPGNARGAANLVTWLQDGALGQVEVDRATPGRSMAPNSSSSCGSSPPCRRMASGDSSLRQPPCDSGAGE